MNNYNYLILLFSFILLIHSCKTEKKEEPLAESKTASETYQILGTLKNIADSTWVYINHDNKKIDSTQIIDERFQFKGTLDEPSSFFIIVGKENREYFYLWAENLKITIEGEKGNLKKATIIAGKSQKESALLTKRNDSLQTEFTKVIEKLQSQDVAQMTKEDRGNLIKSQNVLVAEMEKNSQDFIKEFSDSYVSVNLLNGYSRSWNKNVVTQLFNNLSDSMKKSKNGKDIAHFLSLPDTPKIGEKYIDFELPDATEKLVKLSEIKGKYILVEFWASWCVPCIEANPELVKTYNQYKEKGFEIIGMESMEFPTI